MDTGRLKIIKILNFRFRHADYRRLKRAFLVSAQAHRSDTRPCGQHGTLTSAIIFRLALSSTFYRVYGHTPILIIKMKCGSLLIE